ncbi:MAG: UbiA family prenyltransferase [Luminiphilus sp.]|nr:UbiA family prenyltransferase [Luminiphilus sp.]MDG2038317.1 UbiA family prenyltransferase [Luminiphilus sp.]
MQGQDTDQSMIIQRPKSRFAKQLRLWLELIRPHQWSKNLLLFAPALTSFSIFDARAISLTLMAILAFSCAASAGYVLNDLIDLPADRDHPRKKFRPLASGRISATTAKKIGVALLAPALAIAYATSADFLLLIILYLILTTTYSLALKKLFLLDAMTLAVLYFLRISAGAAAIGVPLSTWLIGFALSLFFSLALMKRCSELVYFRSLNQSRLPGRAYYQRHLPLLWVIGIGAAATATTTFCLFVGDPAATAPYASPKLLWIVAALLLTWLGGLWAATYLGKMEIDPSLYVFRRKWSLFCIGTILALTLLAQEATAGLSL